MALTAANVHDLNNMNEAARRAGLGDILEELTTGTDDNSLKARAISGPIVAHQDDSTAKSVADIVSDFNALLAKLRMAGIMA